MNEVSSIGCQGLPQILRISLSGTLKGSWNGHWEVRGESLPEPP